MLERGGAASLRCATLPSVLSFQNGCRGSLLQTSDHLSDYQRESDGLKTRWISSLSRNTLHLEAFTHRSTPINTDRYRSIPKTGQKIVNLQLVIVWICRRMDGHDCLWAEGAGGDLQDDPAKRHVSLSFDVCASGLLVCRPPSRWVPSAAQLCVLKNGHEAAESSQHLRNNLLSFNRLMSHDSCHSGCFHSITPTVFDGEKPSVLRRNLFIGCDPGVKTRQRSFQHSGFGGRSWETTSTSVVSGIR